MAIFRARARDTWPYGPKLKEMLAALLEAAAVTGRPYAVGGAIAMAASGYRRHTDDVDVFILNRDRLVWMKALRDVGLKVEPVFMGHHYMAAHPKGGVRIDILVPDEDFEVSAIKRPEIGKLGDLTFHAFGPVTLAAMKFVASENVPSYLSDVYAMLERGLFDRGLVRQIIAKIEPDALGRYDRQIMRRK
jgi:hypothetical protein